MNKKYMTGLAIVGLAHSASAQATQAEPCLSVDQAEALVTYFIPSAVQAGRTKCAATLAPSDPLLTENSERLTKYRTAAEKAWPQAKIGFGVMAGDKLPAEVDDEILRFTADAMITQLISEEIKPKDCALFSKIYHDLAPMPSANLASLTITIVQAATKDSEKRNIPICKAPA